MRKHYDFSKSVGVANIDVYKRSDVLSPLERALDELLRHQARLAREALTTPAEKTEFEYGRVCGSFQTIEIVRSILEHCLDEGDPTRARHEES